MVHRSWRRVIAALVGVAVAVRVEVLFSTLGFQPDLHRYWQLSQMPGRPFVDYAAEYPVAMLAIFHAVGLVAQSEDAFRILFTVLMIAVDIALFLVLRRSWGNETAIAYAIVTTPLAPFLYTRCDLLAVLAVVVAIAAWKKERPVWAGIAIALAVSVKVWPIVVAVVLLAVPWRALQWKKYFITVVASGIVSGGIGLLIGGWNSIADVVTLRGSADWQIESVGGSITRLFSPGVAVMENGAERYGHIPSGVGIALPMIGFLAAIAVAWIAGRKGAWELGWIGGVILVLITSSVFSPQFLLWLAPAVAMLWWTERRIAELLIVVSVLSLLILLTYGGLTVAAPASLWLVVVRNALVVGVAAFVVLRIFRPARVGFARAGSSAGRGV